MSSLPPRESQSEQERRGRKKKKKETTKKKTNPRPQQWQLVPLPRRTRSAIISGAADQGQIS